MKHLTHWGASLLTLTLCATSLAADLQPGSAAPALSVKKWLKGTPIKALAPNRIYVIDFWATWCIPCRDGMPALSELARQNRDVTFMGAGIWEPDKGGVLENFVTQMGAKMNYLVFYSGFQDGMASTWMKAAGQDSIPTAFIVKGGKIQWIGDPKDLSQPLSEIKAGTFDLAKHAKAFRQNLAKKKMEESERNAFAKELDKATKLFEAGKRTEARSVLVSAAAAHPSFAEEVEQIAFEWLAVDDAVAWETSAKAFAASKGERQLKVLTIFAMKQLSLVKPGDLEKAKVAMDLAVAATGSKDMWCLYYQGLVYSWMDDFKGAEQALSKAVDVFQGEAFIRTAIEQARDEVKQGRRPKGMLLRH